LAKLGSWDRLEYYWTRAATESTQRKLHKLTRHAQDILKRPVAAILAGAGAAVGFPDLAPQPDAAIVISDALPDAQDAVSAAADAAKKKRRRAMVRPAKGAVAKVLQNSEAAEPPGAEPAKPAAQKAAAEAVQAAEQAAQRHALQVWLRRRPAKSWWISAMSAAPSLATSSIQPKRSRHVLNAGCRSGECNFLRAVCRLAAARACRHRVCDATSWQHPTGRTAPEQHLAGRDARAPWRRHCVCERRCGRNRKLSAARNYEDRAAVRANATFYQWLAAGARFFLTRHQVMRLTGHLH